MNCEVALNAKHLAEDFPQKLAQELALTGIIKIPKGNHKAPVYFIYRDASKPLKIELEAHAKAIVVEICLDTKSTTSKVPKQTDIYLREASSLQYALFLQNTEVSLNVILDALDAQYQGQVLMLPRFNQEASLDYLVTHSSPQTESQLTVRSVVEEQAKSRFKGKILVEKAANQTNARFENKNLLLSDTSIAESYPELEIYQQNVQCSHGATVGELEKDSLFYLQSRGIPESMAQALLIQAFIDPVMQYLKIPALYEVLKQFIYDESIEI